MVTLTQNHVKITGHRELNEVLMWIKHSKKLANLVLPMRRAKKQKKDHVYQKLKEQLPAFIVSGIFKWSIKSECLSEYSGLVILDYDNIPIDLLTDMFKIITASRYTHACFISPSGLGLKVVVKVNTGKEYHELAYKQLSDWYYSLTGLKSDHKCKNINRLCYLSYDPGLYYNDNALTFKVNLTWQMIQGSLFAETEENDKEKPLKPIYHMNNGTMETYYRF